MAASNFTLLNIDLNSMFEYRDGDIYWKVFSGNGSIKPGTKAGTMHPNGYKSVRIQKRMFKQHRVIFVMFYGKEPVFVDHIDGNPSNNRIENLREATPAENSRNSRKHARNKSGIKGVCWHKKKEKWIASCSVDGQLRHIGYFLEKSDAEKAVKIFREKNHGNFANHG